MRLPPPRTQRILLALFACIVFRGPVKAQEITAAELLAPIGSSFHQYEIMGNFPWDTLQGPDVLWDYGWTVVDSTIDITYVVIDLNDAPDAASYPLADRAVRSIGGTNDDYIIDRFFTVGSDRMDELGSVGPVLSYVYDMPESIYGLPMTLGDTLHTSYCYGSDGFGTQFHFCGDSYVTFDAIGSLVLPFGTFTNVKHLTHWKSILETTIPWTEPNYLIQQQWFAPGFAQHILEVSVYIDENGLLYPSGHVMDQASLTGIAEANAVDALSVFPNPATDVITFNRIISGPATLTLLSPDGRVVRTERMAAGETQRTIALTDLPNGPYLVRLTGPAGTTALRVMKQ
ncbi:MAG: T9SS type A sorting domain-containing protein [Flavobacteriales bacterium]|nr:T9SS type A sorting domain-containing protein [Flavobacteriales bacterium]